MYTRRALLSLIGAGAAAVAGCTAGPPDPGTPPNGSESPGDGPRRPSATPRDLTPLDATGSWPLRRADPVNTGTTSLAGVPDDATDFWHLRRLESGPAVVADGQLFHLAELSQDPDRRTATSTMTPGGTYIIRDGDPHLVARDAATGDLDWYVRLNGAAGGLPAVRDYTVVAAVTGHLLATDTASGDVRWQRNLGEAVGRNPLIVDDTVYLPTNEDVRAYALADGSRRWRTPIAEYADGVTVDAGTVYASTTNGTAYAIDADSGEQRWRQDTVGEAGVPPTVAGDTLFVGGSAGSVAAHTTTDGERRWTVEVGSNGHGGVAVTDETVLYAGGGAVRALARGDGSERWAYEVSENYPVTPSVADGVVYGGGRGPYDPVVFALDLATGTHRWSVGLPRTTVEGDIVDGGLAASPVVVAGAVYAYAVDGLYAFGPA